MPGDAFNGWRCGSSSAASSNKPLFVGEVGFQPTTPAGRTRAGPPRCGRSSRPRPRPGSWATSSGAGDRRQGPRMLRHRPRRPVPALLAARPEFETRRPRSTPTGSPRSPGPPPNRALYMLNEPLTASFSCRRAGAPPGELRRDPAPAAGRQHTPTPVTSRSRSTRPTTSGTTDRLAGLRRHRRRRDDDRSAGPGERPTDPGNIGASAAVPVQTSVAFTAPAGPETPVSIDMHPANIAAPSGYAILGNEVDINLSGVTARRTARSSSPSSSTRPPARTRRRSPCRGRTPTRRPTSPWRATRCPRRARIPATRPPSSAPPARTCG